MGNRLYVGNLSFKTTDDGLRTAFAQHGTVAEAQIVMDRETGQSRGFGFVTMNDDAGARAAQEKMHGSMLDGRALRVNEAEERQRRGPGEGGGKRRW